jgi:DNA-binding CsgD family transcriptional regulator
MKLCQMTAVLTGSGLDDGRKLIAMETLARLRARRGEPGSHELLDEALTIEEPGRPVVEWIVRLPTALAERAWLAGDRDAVAPLLEGPFSRAVERGEPWWLGEVAFWLWRVGRLERVPSGVAEPYALLLGGCWLDAYDAWTAMGCPYEAARALACADDEDALRKAVETFDALGARGERDEGARRLRRLGVRDVPRTPRRSARAGSEIPLSPRESEVLELLAVGMRNAEIAAKLFLSERTVEHHVASLLRKLDTHSRRDAVQKAGALGLLATQSAR